MQLVDFNLKYFRPVTIAVIRLLFEYNYRHFTLIYLAMAKNPVYNIGKMSNVAKSKPWFLGLTEAMNDPGQIVQEDDKIVVIKDKYPKAKHHFLVMPREHIDGLFKLNLKHLPLLRHMQNVAEELCRDRDISCKIGYHSIPSMASLHLHIISDDMVSPCLKTKKHWNSFTTRFFIPSEDVIEMVGKNGAVTKISDAAHKLFMATPLKCHKCSFLPKNIPQLKEHILTHLK